jgi:hypothetical protein
MRFHVVSLPHTQTTREYSNCAFATLARGFARMMMSLGHEVILYSGQDNDVEVTEHVTCITKKTQKEWFNVEGPDDILSDFLAMHMYEPQRHWWAKWNNAVRPKLLKRLEQGDFVCLFGGGILFDPIVQAVRSKAIVVEPAVGYAGVHPASFVGYGSARWQAVMQGLYPAPDWRGRSYDRVIPHYFENEEFEYRQEKGDYLLYLGKLKMDKGVEVASRAAELTGNRIIFAGQGPTPIPYGETVGRVGPDERRELLAGARAVLVPSLYIEPFGMVAVEALLSGTPIITSPWGGLGDINTLGTQCHIFRDYLRAVDMVDSISPARCRELGVKYLETNVRYDYDRWFDDLGTLWGEGWTTGWNSERSGLLLPEGVQV